MANVNRVRNGGFEQSSPPTVGPFWTATGTAVTATGDQLLGDNYAILAVAGDAISQPLLPLQVGENYTFQAAFSTASGAGTIDVEITGQPTRSFQALNVISGDYAFYNFDFTATTSSPTLTIRSTGLSTPLQIDVVSVKLA
ncbi:hypothetical protein [Metabacillus sediminilitoris]|uniref:Carbohydrate binding protein n=1 Tax=Metabacillus sediminilitoris TaxID=2567941 RepID=A0A4S4BWV3_9BACI|nr:hypothetical protein [Metabacillus sediminilitoris]QGQ44717.1 hypothetical protein GMB29_05195 [Metabacillus sediminilitoris]THF78935.1 hypothetical protein E6W99_14535 [Metabacillus sediminilitoris]